MRTALPDMKLSKRAELKPLSLHGFGGGLNTSETDNGMNAQFCVVLNNFRRVGRVGSMTVRYGSQWFADVNSVVSGDIIDIEYFANALIAVTENGEVAAVDNDGIVTAIWNSAIAALLLGSPSGWSTGLTIVDFVPFKNELIIHNGVDKPISINGSLVVTYLQDAATGSNVNVPIGKFGCVVSNYHCVAGISVLPTSIYITAIGTSGTFPGDPDPNDSISIDVGAYAPEGAPDIRGIAGFRSFLIVFFAGQSILIQLGVYDADGVHVPTFPDAFPAFGLFGHRCLMQVESDLLFAGNGGIASAKKNLNSFTGSVENVPINDIIDPSFRRVMGLLTDTQLKENCFFIYDKLSHDLMLYSLGGNAATYSYNVRLRYKSWSTFSGPSWISGCASSLGRVFFTKGSRIYQYGNNIFADEAYRADLLQDRDANWTTGFAYTAGYIARNIENDTSYICTVSHISGGTSFNDDLELQALDPKWEVYTGEAIEITQELPWVNGANPMEVKFNKFISIASNGDAEFTTKVWVDNLYKDNDGVVIHDPALSMDFVGNNAPGFGYDAGPYGGGRRSADPRLFQFPVKFKTIKVSITGSVKKTLEIAGITFLYLSGRFKR